MSHEQRYQLRVSLLQSLSEKLTVRPAREAIPFDENVEQRSQTQLKIEFYRLPACVRPRDAAAMVFETGAPIQETKPSQSATNDSPARSDRKRSSTSQLIERNIRNRS